MFLQLSDIFSRGLENYQKQYSTTTNLTTNTFENAVVKEVSFAVGTLSEVAEKMNQSIIETQRKILNDYQNRLQTTDEKEEKSPKKNKDKKDKNITTKILQLIEKNNYEDAFTLALSVQNLDLISWLISTVDTEVIFSQKPAGLTQRVLISLIQQLGCNLETNVQKKLDWLQYCLVDLDPMNVNISSYVVSVLTELQQNLDSVNYEFVRNARLLNHLITNILTRFHK